MTEFKLEHGKRYVTSNGIPTDFAVMDARLAGWNARYPFIGAIAGENYSWTEGGVQLIGHMISDLNLVAEYVPPPEPKWVAFTKHDPCVVGRVVRLPEWAPGIGGLIVGSFIDMNGELNFTHFPVSSPANWTAAKMLDFGYVFADTGLPFGKQVPQ